MILFFAGIAHLVERNLAMVEATGSNPVTRSNFGGGQWAARDVWQTSWSGSIPGTSTNYGPVDYDG